MTEVSESPVVGQLETITLKDRLPGKNKLRSEGGCARLVTEATPILSGSEVVGFRFDNVS